MDAWTKFEKLLDVLGAETLANEIANAMSTDLLHEYCDYIARCHDVDFEDEDSED